MRVAARAMVWLAAALTVVGSACRQAPPHGPPEVHWGEDACAQCRMIVSERRFAAALWLRDRGRYEPRVFDDVGCLVRYLHGRDETTVMGPWVWPYRGASGWKLAREAAFVRAPGLETPMGYGIVAFADEARAASFAAEHPGSQVLAWSAVRKLDLRRRPPTPPR